MVGTESAAISQTGGGDRPTNTRRDAAIQRAAGSTLTGPAGGSDAGTTTGGDSGRTTQTTWQIAQWPEDLRGEARCVMVGRAHHQHAGVEPHRQHGGQVAKRATPGRGVR